MLLFYTQNSPYARIARVAVREFGLRRQVTEKLARNRAADNPVLTYSPAGRVPTLVDGDLVLSETRLIYDYLVQKAGKALAPKDWNDLALAGQISSFMDGICLWVRERYRPEEQQSPFLFDVEAQRADRSLAFLQAHATQNTLPALPTYDALTLVCALDLMQHRSLCPGWATTYPDLQKWALGALAQKALQDTTPGPAS